MEKISAQKVLQVAAELGLHLTQKSSEQLSKLANLACLRRQQQGGEDEPETLVSMALLAIAEKKQKGGR